MWEPFTAPARRAVVRSQEVAQMFGAHYIGTEHMIFALGEGDDPVGAALATAVDRNAIREQLGSVSRAPSAEMVFSRGAKQSIELAFENARRLNHPYIGTAHMALGILASAEPPPLVPGHDAASLRAALEQVAAHDEPASAAHARRWKRTEDDEPDPVADAVASTLMSFRRFGKEGTRVTVTLAEPGKAERAWSWVKEPDA
jgi:ATP-dependent Clp protease ATP-binding subunit ClpC